jgi:hypothetical protein
MTRRAGTKRYGPWVTTDERGVGMTKTERIAGLEKEVAQAAGWTDVIEVEGHYLAEQCLKAEGREVDADNLADVLGAAHDASRAYIPAAH